ncbi:MAG: alpha/beta hydrolase-fold protein [Deltaproteobacteria bacterium]
MTPPVERLAHRRVAERPDGAVRRSLRNAIALRVLALASSACTAPAVQPRGGDAGALDVTDALEASHDAPRDRQPDDPDDGAVAADALRIVLYSVPENTPPGDLYVAGDFNAWSPGDAAYALQPGPDGVRVVTLAGLAPGARVELKFTRGSWATVEQLRSGAARPNRVVVFDPSHPVVALFVERWADLPAPASTRSPRVQRIAGVTIPQLAGQTRDVWVYVPPGYDTAPTTERYPVMYMFDGQNLFDAGTATYGDEWRVDETLDALYLEGRLPGILVVAAENSPLRPCEYNVFASDPHPQCADGSARGDAFNRFYVETLKPRIDGAYRTRPGREYTALAGSSMGGSLAMRAGFTQQGTYSRVAALSPSYQNSLSAIPAMPDYVRAQRPALSLRIYQDMGTAEQIRDLGPDVLLRNLYAVRDALAQTGLAASALSTSVSPGAQHNEVYWANRLQDVILWLWL